VKGQTLPPPVVEANGASAVAITEQDLVWGDLRLGDRDLMKEARRWHPEEPTPGPPIAET